MVNPNSDLGKWLGVYATLGVVALISVLFGTWYDGSFFYKARVLTSL
jgi:hypothetical protein